MIKVGIDKLAIYTPRYKLELAVLAKARAIDADKYQIGLGQHAMSVAPPGEDIITMGANAAKTVLEGMSASELSNIELLLFATESSIDQSKAAGLYIHELLCLSSRCRTLELKQACYSGTAGLQLAMPYLRENPQKKVLLITSDIARYGLGAPAESSQGAGAAAMLLSTNPRLLELEPHYGVITESVMDFWRPNYRTEALVDGKYSSKLYLTMLEKSWQQYQTVSGHQFADHAYFCYHAPVPRLVEKAHQHLRKINGLAGVAEKEANQAVAPSLEYSRQIGNSYSAALYICLASLLDHTSEDLTYRRIGFYSYGSGCVAEYFSGIVQPGYRKVLESAYHADLIKTRTLLNYNDYATCYHFQYVEDGSDQSVPLYDTGFYRLATLSKHKRLYQMYQKIDAQPETVFFSPLEFPTSKTCSPVKKVFAPGKLILSGEHAVVHGMPALAMAIDRYATATVTPGQKPHISFDFSDLSHRSHLTFQALKQLKKRLKEKYRQFIYGDFHIRQVLQKPFELAQFALSLIASSLDFSLPHGIKVHLQSDIPIGCGLGSSAATILSVMQAIALHLQIPISPEKLFKMALEAENLQHGQSSGLDLRIALNGGCLWMQGACIEARPLPQVPFYLINTGTPLSTTGQCVAESSKHFHSRQLKQAFADVTQTMDKAIKQHSFQAMRESVRHNHQLLVLLGVVPDKVQKFIKAIEEREAAGKICGAGAVRGEQAGAVLVTTQDKALISDLCLSYGYSLLPVRGVGRGVYAA